SVYLLYNAGYDPARAAAFWTRERGDVVGELLRSRTHASAKARAAAVAAEIVRIPAGAARPIRPEILSARGLALER
ncbi:MAG TPA: peptidase M48 family protein, partial [Sphingomicrobium sp.]